MPLTLRSTTQALYDLLAYVAIIIAIPFVILAIGAPIVLFLRLVLWVTGTL